MTNRRKDRFKLIEQAVSGKRVLDVGCVDHHASKEEESEWLHRVVVESASDVVGLDFEKREVEELSARGYKVIFGDAEEVKLDMKFEVVVAGELIEHLSNPGRFLSNMRDHLVENGTIVLTTPNPFYPKRLMEIVWSGKAGVHPQHVMWYCPTTLAEILRRAGFGEIKIVPFNNTERYRWLVSPLTKFRPWLSTQLFASAKKIAV